MPEYLAPGVFIEETERGFAIALCLVQAKLRLASARAPQRAHVLEWVLAQVALTHGPVVKALRQR